MNPNVRLSCHEVTVWQDGLEVSEPDLQRLAASIKREIDLGAHARVALATARTDQVIASIVACQASGSELLLARERHPDDSPLWRQWGVTAVIDETLRLTAVGDSSKTPDGFCILLTTSGTTGAPKVARHAVERLLGRLRAPRSGERSARWLLTYHPASFAGLQVILTAMAFGGQLICSSRNTIAALVGAAASKRPTHISGTPSFWRSFLLALGQGAREIPLTQITLGGEAVDQATLDRLRFAFPDAALTHIYASTEAGALFAVRDRRAGFPAVWLGRDVEGVQLRLRDGELEVRSPRAMEGYVAGSNVSPFGADGWLRTGDLVRVEGDRALFHGRVDSTINVGGAKVSPEEVEAVLLELPFVVDARVYAAKNPITGALVAAELILREGSEAEVARRKILAHARARLAEYKVPRIIRFVGEIDASPVGKKQRV